MELDKGMDIVGTLVAAEHAMKNGSGAELNDIATKLEAVGAKLRKLAAKPRSPHTGYIAMAPGKPYGVVIVREKKGEDYVIHGAYPARRRRPDGLRTAEQVAISLLRDTNPAAVRLLQVNKTWWRTE